MYLGVVGQVHLAVSFHLFRWMTRFQAHLKEGIEMLKRGQAVHSRVGRGQAKKLADKKAYTGSFLLISK